MPVSPHIPDGNVVQTANLDSTDFDADNSLMPIGSETDGVVNEQSNAGDIGPGGDSGDVQPGGDSSGRDADGQAVGGANATMEGAEPPVDVAEPKRQRAGISIDPTP